MKTAIAMLGIALVAGCSTGSVIQAGPDTYSVTSAGAGFSTDGVRSSVYNAANEHCTKLGLVMVEVSMQAQSGVLGARPPNADLKFRCLRQGDPEIARRTGGIQGIAVGQLVTNDSPATPANKYTQLKNLKELLDSGALTQTEFNTQKAKLLAE